MLQSFNILLEYKHALAFGFLWTLVITCCSLLFGTALGALLAIASISKAFLIAKPARLTIECLLAAPALIIMIWLYYCLPFALPALQWNGSVVAIISLSLSLSAFVAEIIRAGIASVPRGQLDAAYCTGLSRYQSFRYIILPQALGIMWPPLMGQYVTCYKFSTLASVIAVPELLHQGDVIIAQTYRPLEIYTIVGLIFVITVIPLNILARRLSKSNTAGVVSL